LTSAGRLYNTAAVFHKGSAVGLYRKLHPAINRSIWDLIVADLEVSPREVSAVR
jgi:predicted amidohydrolase